MKIHSFISHLTIPEVSLLLFLALIIVFRFYQLGSVPISTYWDETAMMVDIKAILATGKDMHGLPWYQTIFPSYGDYKLPLYIWLAVLPAKLLGVTPFSLRLVSAVAGILTIFVTGLLSRRLTLKMQLDSRLQRLIFLSSMLVVASSPWSFMFSRTAFEGHVSQIFLALSVYLLLTPSRRGWSQLLAGVCGALAIYGYYASRFVLFPLWLFSILLHISETSKLHWKKYVLTASLGIVICLLLMLPLKNSPWYQAMQTFRLSASSILNPPPDAIVINQWREWSGNSLISRFAFHRNVFLLRELASHYSDHVSLKTLFLQGDSNLRHSTTHHGLFLWPFFISLFVGIVFLLKRIRLLLFLGLWWLLALLPASVPTDTPHALRSLNALVPISILLGIGTAVVLYQYYKPVLWKKAFSLLFILLLFFSSASFMYYYFSIYPYTSANSWQSGLVKRVKSLQAEINAQEPVLILVNDSLFYLYLMAYGSFNASEFSIWPEKEFKKLSSDTVYFDQDDMSIYSQHVNAYGSGYIIVDENRDLKQLEDKIQTPIFQCKSIFTSNPPDSFRLCRASSL